LTLERGNLRPAGLFCHLFNRYVLYLRLCGKSSPIAGSHLIITCIAHISSQLLCCTFVSPSLRTIYMWCERLNRGKAYQCVGISARITMSASSGHRPFLERTLTKPEETYDACVHSCDDDSFFALAKCHEGVRFNWRRLWHWLCGAEQDARQ
jgi:hypothetical protein